jgi:hypothetical protein
VGVSSHHCKRGRSGFHQLKLDNIENDLVERRHVGMILKLKFIMLGHFK